MASVGLVIHRAIALENTVLRRSSWLFWVSIVYQSLSKTPTPCFQPTARGPPEFGHSLDTALDPPLCLCKIPPCFSCRQADLASGWCSDIVYVCVSHVWLFTTPWTVACEAPLSMEFFRQEYWSGLPCPLGEPSQPRGWTQVSCTGRRILYYVSHQGSLFGWYFLLAINHFSDTYFLSGTVLNSFPLLLPARLNISHHMLPWPQHVLPYIAIIWKGKKKKRSVVPLPFLSLFLWTAAEFKKGSTKSNGVPSPPIDTCSLYSCDSGK